jgi:peptidoglycan hydrolase-like protein with peptidoglycan-binding domain
MRPYQQPGLRISIATGGNPDLVRALQQDLRALGYLRGGMDGKFGTGTHAAVCSLQYDLMHNDGKGADGAAPVAVASYNKGAIQSVDGVVTEALAACIGAMLDDRNFVRLPSSAQPATENQKAMLAIETLRSTDAPSPFIAAMVLQESGGQHFRVPSAHDADNFIVVGLDRNAKGVDAAITSRGYGIGQYTLFHHPPRQSEVDDFMLDARKNVGKAHAELQLKFQRFVAGPSDAADDRSVEVGHAALRTCRYPSTDVKYMTDCVNCAKSLPAVSIHEGTPVYKGASIVFAPTQYYSSANYEGVPERAKFPCDWPYAARRYNGSGVNSYHYQARILWNLAHAVA